MKLKKYAVPATVAVLTTLFSTICNNNTFGKALFVNEILASNTAYYASNSVYADWIEIYNDSSVSMDLGGYYLTDDKLVPDKWMIPAGTTIISKKYKIFYADELNTQLHTNFRLSIEGEFIGFYNPQKVIVDSFAYKRQRNNISYGRSATDLLRLGYFKIPTPDASNGNISYLSMLDKPVFLYKGGFYNNPLSATITAPAGSVIYYTTDGTDPTDASTIYSAPISVDSTMCIRAAAIQDNSLTSEVITQTYFINVTKTLPVISIVTNPANLFSDTSGIYVIGTKGIKAGCSGTPMNLNQDWERPVNIELYDESGKNQINQCAGVKIFGGCSRQRYPIKSFAVFARREYGKGSFDCKLFKSKGINKFESFLIRSSSDDQVYTMFRDGLGHTLSSGLKIETQAYQPALVYINGKYWGIQNIREKYNEAYFEENFGISGDSIDLIDNNANDSWNIKIGNATHYLNMMSYLKSYAADKNIYEYMNTLMDIESYIDYMSAEIYLGADDWPGNNIRYWRAKNGRYNRWRWACYDMDQVIYLNNSRWNSMLLATKPYGGGWPNPAWSVELFNNMLKGNKFKYEFIQRITFLMNTTFSSANILHVIDSLQGKIADEMPFHIQRWGGQLVNDPRRESWIQPLPGSMEKWEENVQMMRSFATDRPDTTVNMLRRFFKLSDTVRITMTSNNPNMGYLYFGPKRIQSNVHTGAYFSNIPMTLNAKPKPGYRFVHWEVTPSGSSSEILDTCEILYVPKKNTTFNAVFEPVEMEGHVVVINEINYHSPDHINAGDWVELYNRMSDAVDISGWFLKDENNSHTFTFPEHAVLPVNGYYVVCEDTGLFIIQFPKVSNRKGNFSFGLGNSGDCIKLYDAYMSFVDSVRYSDNSPWPILADGFGSSLSLIAPDLNNDLISSWSDQYMLTPGDTNIKESEAVIVLNKESKQGNRLYQNYPNPCSGNTMISYEITNHGKVSLTIIDMFGRQVRSLVKEYQNAGSYKAVFDAGSIASGTYFYALRINGSLVKTRMMAVR
jgi:hypothetical protein